MQTVRSRWTSGASTPGAQDGFTLLELLVVIAVLGVLSGVVVFSMGNMTERAEQNACAADERVLMTALEAYSATTGAYGDEDTLVAAGYLRSGSSSHDVVLTADGYSIVAIGACVSGGSEEIAEGPDSESDGSEDQDAEPPAEVEDEGDVKDPPDDESDGGKHDDGTDDGGKDDELEDEGDVKDLGDGGSSCGKGQVDLNSASVKDLGTIAHMNPSRAEAAVKLRPFTSVDDLVRVKGIEKKHLSQIHKQGKACV